MSISNTERKYFFQGPLKFKGTGCKGGEYSFSGQSTDTLTVMFINVYDAAKPKDKAASKMERTACSFVVPVKVPPDFQLSTLTSDWLGYVEGRTELFREYFFADQRGPSKTIKPTGNYTERDNLMYVTWSHCNGGTVLLRINSSVRAASSHSFISLDKQIFHLQWRKCRADYR